MGIINTRHRKFYDEYLQTSQGGKDVIECYRKIYPNASENSARVKGSYLLNLVEGKAYIQEHNEKIRIERQNKHIEAVKKESNVNVLKREKAIEMVSNVAKIQYMKIADKESGHSSSDVMAFNGTIERLAKLDGWDDATKLEIKGNFGALPMVEVIID